MADESTSIITLKALVNRGNQRVIFMESGHEFVDVLLSFLTIPIGTIIRLSRKKSNSEPGGLGCMNLYASVETMNVQHFRTEACRDMLLCPRNGAGSILNSLKLKVDDCDPSLYYKCSNEFCRTSPARLSYYRSVRCSRCGNQMDSKRRLLVGFLEGVFVKELARVIISDDLQVMPAVTSVSSSLLMKLGVMHSNTIQEVTLDIGVDEVVNLLLRSFISRTPLTDVRLHHRPLANLKKDISNLPICIDDYSARVEDMANDEVNITLKLIVSKSKVVCYAEAGEDFVHLLFSFLVLPLSFLLKQIRHSNLKGCIDHLYKSVHDLDQQLLKSRYSKEVLLDPKLAPGFCYQNHPLGIGMATFQITAAEIVDPKSPSGVDQNQGFLKGPARFVVTDNLIVTPPVSPGLGPSILDKMNVPITDIEVQTVLMGKEEAFRLLVASFIVTLL